MLRKQAVDSWRPADCMGGGLHCSLNRHELAQAGPRGPCTQNQGAFQGPGQVI